MDISCIRWDWLQPEGWHLAGKAIRESENRYLLEIRGTVPENSAASFWQTQVRPAFQPTFYYTPHLTPGGQHVIDMHVFRTPCLMMGDAARVVCLLPVTDGFPNGQNRWFMDLDAQNNIMTMGITTTKVDGHVLYKRTDEARFPAGEFCFRMRVMLLEGEDVFNPYKAVLRYFWERYGRRESGCLPSCAALIPYVQHTYSWAFDRWKQSVWQEMTINGRRVGAPQMIVITRQSPNYRGEFAEREKRAVWNNAWFSSLRSAMGLYRYGKRTGREDLVEKAEMTRELALSFPQQDGLFDGVIIAAGQVKDGHWEAYEWGNSNRNPVTADLRRSPRHLLDMSWTALRMLDWYEELEQDERLLDYVRSYADALHRLQRQDGFFPAWLDAQDGHALEELSQSPESAVSASLLLRLYALTREQRDLQSAVRCIDALVREVLPDSRWEDFETYWSCSRFGGDMQGKKYPRNGIGKRCSLSPFYMAQALRLCWQATGEERYLRLGERCLCEMMMFQSSFQPDYMPIPVIGGFGVMNGDAELNDARQSLFAEEMIRYGSILSEKEYVERGLAALRASFSMMYCPENGRVKAQWEQKWPFFNEKDYGFMMENYGHDGYADACSLGIGEFTIYDWGNGAASEAVMRISAHWPEYFEQDAP